MSKFNFALDSDGNVTNIAFPKTNIAVKVEYQDSAPSKVSIGEHSLSVEQFSEIKIEKDINDNVVVETGSSDNELKKVLNNAVAFSSSGSLGIEYNVESEEDDIDNSILYNKIDYSDSPQVELELNVEEI